MLDSFLSRKCYKKSKQYNSLFVNHKESTSVIHTLFLISFDNTLFEVPTNHILLIWEWNVEDMLYFYSVVSDPEQ